MKLSLETFTIRESMKFPFHMCVRVRVCVCECVGLIVQHGPMPITHVYLKDRGRAYGRELSELKLSRCESS